MLNEVEMFSFSPCVVCAHLLVFMLMLLVTQMRLSFVN